MPPKKKLSKKEKARLEAEQAELLRIEMEKEKQRKIEEERQRRQIEREQAKRRLQEEIAENKLRRAQLKNSMLFFDAVKKTIDDINAKAREKRDWDKYMRCNGLPNANIPSDLRKYIHQWKSDIEKRNKESRNWLLRTDELSILTHDENVENLTREHLRKQQGNSGDAYAGRIQEILGILNELDDALSDKAKAPHTIADLNKLKTEIRVLLNEFLDDFTYKLLTYIERDMDIDRPGVSKHIYESPVFKNHMWTYTKDAQISVNPKARIGDQNQHTDVEFPVLQLDIILPPTVKLPCSALRGLWLNYDHFSDYCPSFVLRKPRPDFLNILMQTKKEWRKRKEILQSMLDECSDENIIAAYNNMEQEGRSSSAQKSQERVKDVDKLYTEYEDELNKARRRAIGPESYNLSETDVNLRKYRIIGGVYCIDYMETPMQDKRLNSRSFIRTITSGDTLVHKNFYQTYKPPPPVQPGVRRLPEEIEAEMRMIEAALDKLALVTVQLPDSVIWFEPPIACRWETHIETLESELTEVTKPPTTATPTETTPRSTITNLSPLKSSPRSPIKMRKRGSQKSTIELPVTEISDFDMYNIPTNIDIYGLFKDFVVPRLPPGFTVRIETGEGVKIAKRQALSLLPPQLTVVSRTPEEGQTKKSEDKVILLARHKNINTARPSQVRKRDSDVNIQSHQWNKKQINEDFLDLDEPRECFQIVDVNKVLKFKDAERKRILKGMLANAEDEMKKENEAKLTRAQDEHTRSHNGDSFKNGKDNFETKPNTVSERSNTNGNGNGNAKHISEGMNINAQSSGSDGKVDLTTSNSATPETQFTDSKSVSISSISPDLETTKLVTRATYMFSELLEDLDRLVALQMPLQRQEEELKNIAAHLSTPPSSAGSRNNAKKDEGNAEAAHEVTAADMLQSTFGFFPSISFIRDFEATKIDSGGDKKNQIDEKQKGVGDGDDDDDISSSTDYDDYDLDEYYGVGGGADGGYDGSDENLHLHSGGIAGSTLNDLLSNQLSESDSSGSSIGKKLKKSHTAILTQGKWSVRDVHDTKFNEDKFSIQFRTGRLGIFGFALNRYSNMPYQTWEIKPDFKSSGTVLFSFTASIVSLDMNITADGYCINNFQGGSTDAINAMIGKTYSLAEMKEILITSAVDIFPEEDAFCYTEGSCEKNYIMEMHLYACMSTLAQSHNFSWSRWNLLAGSRTVLLLMRELQEGKKVPNHSTLWVTPLKTAIIECTEVSPSFSAVGIPGMEYYADLYQLSQVHSLPSSLEKQRTMDPVLRENVARLLTAVRPLSFC